MRPHPIRSAIASWLWRYLPADAKQEIADMVRPEIQSIVDTLNGLATSIPTSVQTAVANAEALKDQDMTDGTAALNAAVDSVKAAVAAIGQPQPAQ